jgi:hypothetical protein
MIMLPRFGSLRTGGRQWASSINGDLLANDSIDLSAEDTLVLSQSFTDEAVKTLHERGIDVIRLHHVTSSLMLTDFTLAQHHHVTILNMDE